MAQKNTSIPAKGTGDSFSAAEFSDINQVVNDNANDTESRVAAAETKLAGIEDNATADQTGAEIKVAYEGEADTNAFTDAEQTKLAGVEAGATADQTDLEIKTAYENNADTNAFTDAEKTKLAGVETGATADQTDLEIKTAYENNADTNAFTDAEKTKLAGVEDSATADPVALDVAAAGIAANNVVATGPRLCVTTDDKYYILPIGVTCGLNGDNSQFEEVLTSEGGTFKANFELADSTGVVLPKNVMGQQGGTPTIGDGVTTSGRKLAFETNARLDGYIYLTTQETATNGSYTLRHDGGSGATGICYSVDGGATVYTAVAADTNLNLNIASLGGGPQNITFWPATSATSGKVGNITWLTCISNNITSLDVSNATALIYLHCGNNNIASLDVSNNTALISLYCFGNNISSLDVSNNTALTLLYAYSNPLTGHFDASTMSTGFSYINLSNTSITSLSIPSEVTFVPSDSSEWINIATCNFDAAALDAFYSSLDPTPAGGGSPAYWINVSGNSGTASDDPSLAPAAYTIIGS